MNNSNNRCNMDNNGEKLESVRIAHLTMLQGVITRMGSNSFTLKALSATFGSGAIAVMATVDTPSFYYAIAAIVPVVLFWYMDARYLRYERAYRKLYDKVRNGDGVDPYSLDASPFMKGSKSTFRTALSWSVSFFYLAMIISFAILTFLIHEGSP